MNHKIFIKLLLIVCISVSQVRASEEVSIYNLLLDSADKYDGEKIFTEGFLCINEKASLLYPTRDACENNLYTMAVEIKTGRDLYTKREANGHLAPVEVVGNYKKRDIEITTGQRVASGVIKSAFIVKKDLHRKRIKRVITNNTLLNTINSWLDAIQSESIKELSEFMGVPVESLKEDRVQWLLFEYSNSAKEILKNNPDVNIIQYKTLDEFEDTFVCITSQQRYSHYFVEQLPELGDDVSKFCFEVFKKNKKWIINPGYFGVR